MRVLLRAVPSLTLAQAISQLGDTVVSGTSVFPRGATDDQKKALINRAMRRFYSQPSWKGVDGVARFAVYANQITLPREIMAIKKAGAIQTADDANSLCSQRVPVRNQWYQFSSNGPGLFDSEFPCDRNISLMDLGDGFVTFRDPADAFKLKIQTDVAETGTIRFTGFNPAGTPIYTSTTLGVTLDLSVAGDTTTAVFGGQSLANVFKPITNGRVLLYAVDNVTGDELLIAIYQPGETTPSYRRYQVTGIEEEDRIYVDLCKRAFVRAVADNDLLVPDNPEALALALLAVNYENKDDGRRKEYMAEAVDVLNGELAEWQGDVSFSGSVQVSCFAGGATVRNAR